MVNDCVNPACGTELNVFNTGELYALERRSADTEFFWLCPACVPVVTLGLDATGSVAYERDLAVNARNRLSRIVVCG